MNIPIRTFELSVKLRTMNWNLNWSNCELGNYGSTKIITIMVLLQPYHTLHYKCELVKLWTRQLWFNQKQYSYGTPTTLKYHTLHYGTITVGWYIMAIIFSYMFNILLNLSVLINCRSKFSETSILTRVISLCISPLELQSYIPSLWDLF